VSDMLPFTQGWVEDKRAVDKFLGELEFPVFGDTPAGQEPEAIPDKVFLWDACRKVTGDLLPPRNQGAVGSCVGFGTVAAIEHVMCAEIAAGEREVFKPLVQEYCYGGSRVEVGKGRLRGDGSVGAWAAKFCTQYGILARGYYLSDPTKLAPKYDLNTYSEARCRQWGSTGVPDDLEGISKVNTITNATLVQSFDEACKALSSGYAISVCSNRGFTYGRDKDGFCNPSGVWNHCMALVGYKKTGRAGGFILNSWGATAHHGPIGEGNPSPAGFWADADVVDKMLKQKDSWAFAGVNGFVTRRINWRELTW